MLCCVLFCFSSSCVPSFSGLSIFDWFYGLCIVVKLVLTLNLNSVIMSINENCLTVNKNMFILFFQNHLEKSNRNHRIQKTKVIYILIILILQDLLTIVDSEIACTCKIFLFGFVNIRMQGIFQKFKP